MDGWMDGFMNWWMGRWTDGWADETTDESRSDEGVPFFHHQTLLKNQNEVQIILHVELKVASSIKHHNVLIRSWVGYFVACIVLHPPVCCGVLAPSWSTCKNNESVYCFLRVPACAQSSSQIPSSQWRSPPVWPIFTAWICLLTKNQNGCLGPLTSEHNLCSMEPSSLWT